MGRRPLVEDPVGKLREVVPAGVWRTFELMRVAEEQIEVAKVKYGPARHNALHRAFSLLCPPLQLRNKCEALYVAHCAELLGRVARGTDGNHCPGKPEDTTLGTKAEVLAALSDASTLAPPGQQFSALMESLSAELGFAIPGEPVREPWPHASDEMLYECRRKVAVGMRVLER